MTVELLLFLVAAILLGVAAFMTRNRLVPALVLVAAMLIVLALWVVPEL